MLGNVCVQLLLCIRAEGMQFSPYSKQQKVPGRTLNQFPLILVLLVLTPEWHIETLRASW
jgi:hypothetical protein